ncbi:hypothetical protein DM02DRAFT_616560 [Periconia macrospinosa]|uniref:Uncharacterized protein n=1 Tax=Periconia macrospinosa TaxID=97972 RepID=A0A2V1DJN9_9PLEO|nr:hypothetical protein DM02DRAFT_616560 [Periconia macrospinosa]
MRYPPRARSSFSTLLHTQTRADRQQKLGLFPTLKSSLVKVSFFASSRNTTNTADKLGSSFRKTTQSLSLTLAHSNK